VLVYGRLALALAPEVSSCAETKTRTLLTYFTRIARSPKAPPLLQQGPQFTTPRCEFPVDDTPKEN